MAIAEGLFLTIKYSATGIVWPNESKKGKKARDTFLGEFCVCIWCRLNDVKRNICMYTKYVNYSLVLQSFTTLHL